MQNEIVLLPIRFQRDGFLYWQVCRTDKAAIYEQRMPDGRAVFYEVWAIRYRKPCTLHGKDYPLSERAPGTGDWGAYGWTYYSLPQALKRYDLLNGRDNVPAEGDTRILAAAGI